MTPCSLTLRAGAAVAVTSLLLGACGGGGDDTATPAPAEVPTSLTGLAADSAATQALNDALTGLRVGNTGTFDAVYTYADQRFDYTGVYRLSPAEQRLTFTADLGEAGDGEPVESETVSDAGEFFVRLPADGDISSRCWVTGEPARVTETVGLEFNPGFEKLPGVVVLASTAVGIAEDPQVRDGLLGSVDLTTATALISPRLPTLLGLTGQERVLARLTLDDGVLRDLRVEGPALLAALQEAGVQADPAELERVFAAEAPIEITFDNPGSKVVIETPAPTDVVDLDAADAAEQLSACTP
ncbi:hypothetical protein [Nocardioides nanhaiensis]|uniref:LppX_LprAFG lipoprotein n=1 Tax=Nocardioides nanhaiensis TaxID=1476871 RepID=A0ABP8WYF0_9ACTN